MEGIKVFLTDAVGVVEVLLRLCVGLQLLSVIADIQPLISHYLLVRRKKEKEADMKRIIQYE